MNGEAKPVERTWKGAITADAEHRAKVTRVMRLTMAPADKEWIICLPGAKPGPLGRPEGPDGKEKRKRADLTVSMIHSLSRSVPFVLRLLSLGIGTERGQDYIGNRKHRIPIIITAYKTSIIKDLINYIWFTFPGFISILYWSYLLWFTRYHFHQWFTSCNSLSREYRGWFTPFQLASRFLCCSRLISSPLLRSTPLRSEGRGEGQGNEPRTEGSGEERSGKRHQMWWRRQPVESC